VIVGAGSSGCLLASRLSGNPETSVLLVESGSDLRPDDEPASMRDRNPITLLTGPQFGDHRYDDILARHTAQQRPTPYQRGRGVGGSSNINGHVAVRGEFPDDYDAWASAGCVGWSGEDVLPIFLALENDLDYGDRAYHGDAGPMTIDRPLVRIGVGWMRRSATPRSTRGTPGSTTFKRSGQHRCHPVHSRFARERADFGEQRVSGARARPAEPRDSRRRARREDPP